MKEFDEFYSTIPNTLHAERMKEVLERIKKEFPMLKPVIKWNQPMFTHHDTYIIGFSVAKNHFAINPEGTGMVMFADEIDKAGYTKGAYVFRIKWSDEVNYDLLKKMISFNIEDKAECTSFWRKEVMKQ